MPSLSIPRRPLSCYQWQISLIFTHFSPPPPLSPIVTTTLSSHSWNPTLLTISDHYIMQIGTFFTVRYDRDPMEDEWICCWTWWNRISIGTFEVASNQDSGNFFGSLLWTYLMLFLPASVIMMQIVDADWQLVLMVLSKISQPKVLLRFKKLGLGCWMLVWAFKEAFPWKGLEVGYCSCIVKAGGWWVGRAWQSQTCSNEIFLLNYHFWCTFW